MPIRRLTATTLAKLPTPRAGSVDYFDAGHPALCLRVSHRVKTWCIFSRFNGRQRRVTLGHYPEMGLAEARKAAEALVIAFRAGHDPVLERKQNTVGVILADWLRDDQAKNRSYNGIVNLMAREIAGPWGARPITGITRHDVATIIRSVAARGAPVQARRLHAYVRRLFAWAVDEGLLTDNPAARFKPPGKEIERDRALTDDEIKAVWQAAADPSMAPYGAIVQTLLLTLARQAEIAELRWTELDLDRGEIQLSGTRTKNGQPHVIPLSPLAVEILSARPRIGASPFVFAVASTGRAATGWSVAKARLDRLANVTGWRVHDLRRTAASGLQRLGVRLEVTEELLGHRGGTRSGIVKVYQTYSYAPEKRAAVTAWAAELERITSGIAPDTNVINLRDVK